MINVDDEMLQAIVADYRYNKEFTAMTDVEIVARIIELHEANKPKPEPVGYIVQEAVQDNTFITGKACVMIRSKPSANSTVPVYTTQPAREPLSERVIDEIRDSVIVELGG